MNDVDFAEDLISKFLQENSGVLHDISNSVASIFEGLCVIYIAKCYQDLLNYQVSAEQLQNGVFKFKCTTRGNPANYSMFTLTKGLDRYEIHHNLSLAGGQDPDTLYVADIAVIKRGSIQTRESIRKNRKYSIQFCNSSDIITFAECKHLLAYSMLIASFLGTVFEIKPQHLEPGSYDKLISKFTNHIFPALLISKGTHIGAESVISSIKKRKYAVIVASDLFKSPDQLFAAVRESHPSN